MSMVTIILKFVQFLNKDLIKMCRMEKLIEYGVWACWASFCGLLHLEIVLNPLLGNFWLSLPVAILMYVISLYFFIKILIVFLKNN